MKLLLVLVFFSLLPFISATAQKADTLIYVQQSGSLIRNMIVNEHLNDTIYIEKNYSYDFNKGEWVSSEQADTFLVTKQGCLFKQFNGKWQKHVCGIDFEEKEPFFEYFDRSVPKEMYERYTPLAKKTVEGMEVWVYEVRLMNIDWPLDVEYRLFFVPGIGAIKRVAYDYNIVLEKFADEQWIKDLW